jgi:hypothetical protein
LLHLRPESRDDSPTGIFAVDLFDGERISEYRQGKGVVLQRTEDKDQRFDGSDLTPVSFLERFSRGCPPCQYG